MSTAEAGAVRTRQRRRFAFFALLGGRDRRDVTLVVLVTLAIGACWAALTPAFQPTDELAHFAHVQAVAETGHPPRQIADTGVVSAESACWANQLALQRVRWAPSQRPP
ncbi:MAG TPA: hypothetical protein VGM91_08875 [Conexibacter sp.]|jgi:hypothetical protein